MSARLDHDRLGFNYRLSDLQAAIGVAQVERLDEMLERARASRLSTRAADAARRRPAGEDDRDDFVLPCEDSGDARRGWFVFVVQLPAGTDRDAVISALARQGVASKAYLPCIHLLPPYRERFGFREGSSPSPSELPSARWRCRSSPR